MTELKRSIFVIPSMSLEDLPKGMGQEMAADFLTGWTAQWDPRLLVALQTLPEWKKADGSAMDLEDALVVCPSIARKKLDQTLRERLELGRCHLVDTESKSRSELVATLLETTSWVASNQKERPLLLDHFYALGYAVLQVQILAKKLRYSWNIDWIMFTEQALSAAKASVSQDFEETERWLQACYDSLSQERDRYCSQQAYLIDVVLLAETTLGKSLDRQFEFHHSFNLLASGSLLESLKSKNLSAWERLEAGIAEEKISLIGGLARERSHSMLSASSVLRDLRRGLQSYTRLGIKPAKVFSRFHAGFTAAMPTWLTQYGYLGSLLASWSDGVVPDKDQAKIRWQANNEGKSIDTIIGHVMDASSADTYIDLADLLANQLDYHHVPTVVLAHWPGLTSTHMQDLMTVISRSPALGKFHTAESYFASTNQPYSSDSFPASAFRSSIPVDPIRQNAFHLNTVHYESLRVKIERLQSLRHLWGQVASQANSARVDFHEIDSAIESLQDQLDGWFDGLALEREKEAEARQMLECVEKTRRLLLEKVRAVLHGRSPQTSDLSKGTKGYLIANPSCHSQRLFLDDVAGIIESRSCTRIQACESCQGNSRLVVDIPPYGFVRLYHQTTESNSQTTSPEVVRPSFWNRLAGARGGIAQSDWTLANEFMEIQIDPKRGHLRSLYIANKRGSRLSGMPSIVRGPADVNSKWDDASCIELTNVELKVIRSTSLVGTIEMTALAKLGDNISSRLTTRFTLWKGARWLEIQVLAEGLDPSKFHCVWRTAWLNEGASLSAWQQGIKGKIGLPLQSTVELIEIDDAEHRIYIAAQGLSAHRRSDARFLNSNIPSDQSGNASAGFFIGLDWPRPYEAAMDHCDAPWIIEDSTDGSGKPDEGAWLAQCNLSNVSFWFDDPRPAVDPNVFPEEEADFWKGKEGDACVWVRETQGKSGTAKLSFFREVAEAWRVDCQGREFDTLTVIDGNVSFSIHPQEQCRILLRWKVADSLVRSNPNEI